ncbi:MAG: DUF6470 family protein [Peptococcia bacterium]
MLLRIQQSWAQIGLNSRLAQVKLKIKEPRLEVKSNQLKVQIDQEGARVECDATQCRDEVGYKTVSRLRQDNRDKAWRTSMDYIANTAANGDMLARIEENSIGDCMAHIAAQAWDDKEFVFNRVPQSPVDITVIPGRLNISWQLGEVKARLDKGTVANNSTLPELKVYLRQKADIKIEYVGSTVDAYR